MKRRFILFTAVAVTVGSSLALTGGLAAGHASHAKSAGHVRVAAWGHKHFHFTSITAHTGDTLKIANNTPAPHTFSLVEKQLLPKTQSDYKNCFTKGNACLDVAIWHKFSNGHIHENPVHAGARGWDKEGSSAKKKGDSVVFTVKKLPKSRPITAPPGTTLHFFCAIHPDMQGTIKVK